jgi:hypothetical protein
MLKIGSQGVKQCCLGEVEISLSHEAITVSMFPFWSSLLKNLGRIRANPYKKNWSLHEALQLLLRNFLQWMNELGA